MSHIYAVMSHIYAVMSHIYALTSPAADVAAVLLLNKSLSSASDVVPVFCCKMLSPCKDQKDVN